MADGFSTYMADLMLGWLAGAAPPAPPAVYVQGHTGPPGSAGTSNVSSVTTRKALTFGSPSAGSVAITNTPQWLNWAGTSGEVWTDVSLWDSLTGGNFLDSIELAGTWYEFTCTQASPGIFTCPGLSPANGQTVYLLAAEGSSLPGGFSAATAYYIVSASGNTFELSATLGGSGINATSAGGGLVAATAPTNPINTGNNLQLSSLTAAFPVAA
jgi:hypothetical protein